jgi:anti-anti-sigma factor
MKDDIRAKSHINTIIIDCSSIFYIDSSGVEIIIEVIKELKQIKINVVLASCHDCVLSMLQKSNFFFDKYSIYASIHDAVVKNLSLNDITSV